VLRVESLRARDVLESAADVFICGDRRLIGLVSGTSMASQPHIIAALSKLDDKHVDAALKAGAVDLVSTSAGAEELVARITLPQRIAQGRDGESVGRVCLLESWAEAETIFSERLVTVLERPVASETYEGRSPQVVARIRLTCREDGSTIDMLIGCTKGSARSLVGILAPTMKPNAEALRDGLREMANNLAGALKESVTVEGVGVTLGLPRDGESDDFTEATRSWELRFDDASIVLGLIPGRGGPLTLQIRELEPGMVLRHDVLNDAGVPFICSGTALTERTIERLADVLGDTFTVSVVAAQANAVESETVGEDGILLFAS